MRRVLFILGQLSDQDAQWLATTGEKVSVDAGHHLIQAGTPSDYVYILLSGSVTVTGPDGRTLATRHSGDVLGEMSMIDASPPIASVTTDDRVEVLRIRKTVLQHKLETDIGFAARFYRALCMFLSDRMRNTIITLGYDRDADRANAESAVEPDELDAGVLDTVHLAGARFERILQTLRG
ncbi:MAG: cyclic nucleotide-binding domain-containing protein [bacterium]|nr:cyclic nucleotide-binding domain-containing protein [bacterium]